MQGRRIAIDATLPATDHWDGVSSLPPIYAGGRDVIAGPDPEADKRRLEEAYGDATLTRLLRKALASIDAHRVVGSREWIDVLEEQKRYYRQRAPEYDDWWMRRGQYDLGPEGNARWFAEAENALAALRALELSGRVLELACGTGTWTKELVLDATHVTAIDSSSEMISINRERVQAANVTYIHADIFDFDPQGRFDACVFGFWLSHVPEVRFSAFWEFVRRALAPAGRVFFVDTAHYDRWGGPSTIVELARRELSDGRSFEIVKRFYEPELWS